MQGRSVKAAAEIPNPTVQLDREVVAGPSEAKSSSRLARLAVLSAKRVEAVPVSSAINSQYTARDLVKVYDLCCESHGSLVGSILGRNLAPGRVLRPAAMKPRPICCQAGSGCQA